MERLHLLCALFPSFFSFSFAHLSLSLSFPSTSICPHCILIYSQLYTLCHSDFHFLFLSHAFSLMLSLSLPSFSLSLALFPFFFPFSYRFFILETIQIPSVMLELQKPGQSAATSEAPGIAARYDSANTITTRPLHESNS